MSYNVFVGGRSDQTPRRFSLRSCSLTIQVMHAAPHGAAFGIVSSVYCGMVLLLSHINPCVLHHAVRGPWQVKR